MMEGEFAMVDLLSWLLWLGMAVMAYGCIAGSVRYIHNIRRGDKTTASQALVQGTISVLGLLALWLLRQHYLQN